jgi:galactose oxidase
MIIRPRYVGTMKENIRFLIAASAAALLLLAPPAIAQLPRAGWTATANSEEPAGDLASNVLDGSTTTFWHTQWVTASPGYPHQLTINMGQTLTVTGLQYLPRQDGNANGYVGNYEIRLSTDGTNFGAPVATGTWANSIALKTATWTAAPARAVRLVALTTASAGPWASAAEINILGTTPTPPATGTPPPSPVILPRTGFTAVASDQNSAGEAAGLVLDGDRGSFWHSKYDNGLVNLPHSLTINFGGTRNIAGVMILPRQDGIPNGHIGGFTVATSTDGTAFTNVVSGTFADTLGEKTVTFTARAARAVRITGATEAGNRGQWTTIAEVNILGYTGTIPAVRAGTFGRWSNMINMPLVPVAAALLPNGQVRCPLPGYAAKLLLLQTALKPLKLNGYFCEDRHRFACSEASLWQPFTACARPS